MPTEGITQWDSGDIDRVTGNLLAIPWKEICEEINIFCVTCHRHEGWPYRAVPPPPLPEFRVTVSHLFEHTGVDFAGPLYVRRTDVNALTRVVQLVQYISIWLCKC